MLKKDVVLKIKDTSLFDSLKDHKLKFHFEYKIDKKEDKKEIKDESYVFSKEEKEKEFEIDYIYNIKDFCVVLDELNSDIGYKITKEEKEENKENKENKEKDIFSIELFKKANTKMSIIYKDAKGENVENSPSDLSKEIKFSFGEDKNLSIALPKKSVEFDLRDENSLKEIFEKEKLEEIKTFVTEENLKNELSIKIDDKEEGSFEIGENKYEFKITKEKDEKGNVVKNTIEIKVIKKETKKDDKKLDDKKDNKPTTDNKQNDDSSNGIINDNNNFHKDDNHIKNKDIKNGNKNLKGKLIDKTNKKNVKMPGTNVYSNTLSYIALVVSSGLTTFFVKKRKFYKK